MEMDFKQLAAAIKLIAEEKNLPMEQVTEIVEQALAAAWRRDYGDREQEVRVTMNLNTGDVDAYVNKEIVEKAENPAFEINLAKAQTIRKGAKVGEEVEVHESVQDFGRVAAQTAKQVILQRLREAERESVVEEFQDKVGTAINGIVGRVESGLVRVDMGRAQAIMPRSEQSQGERYFPGQRMKVYLKEIERGPRGPQLIVSRASAEFVKWLFRSEVPEMESGAVEINGIAREGGVRTKVAVHSTVPGVDPVGTFVGGHGSRINAVTNEIGEQEKIDIIVWDDNQSQYITNALSPTKVDKVELDEKAKKTAVIVPEDQLSIAIGRGGQNVRLASKLTGWEIDVKSASSGTEAKAENTGATASNGNKLKKKSELESSLLEAIEQHGQ